MAISSRLRLSVARRIHLSFIVAAALPLFLLAATAYHLVTSRLEQVALDDARQLAKSMGMDVFERLNFVADQMRLVVERDASRRAIGTGLAELDLGRRTLAFFRVSETGAIDGAVSLSPPERAALGDAVADAQPGKPLLVTVGTRARQRLIMLVSDDAGGGLGRLAAELNLDHLWDTSGVAARPERVCVLDGQQTAVFCNHADHALWVANSASLIASRGRPRPVKHDSGESALTAVWSLYLMPYYQFERWTMLVGVPQSMAFEAIRTFDRLFVGIAVVALLTAFLFGRRLIRSNLEPLHVLNDATRHLAAGDFKHRIALRSGDEFEQLGDAFDGMAARIGDQFDELDTLSRLDRELQQAKDFGAATLAAAAALDALVGPGHCAILCHERWQPPGCLWYHAIAADRVTSSEPPAATPTSDRPDPALLHLVGVAATDEIQVQSVVDSELVAAHIVLRAPSSGDADRARRVADVLGIALTNLAMEHQLFHQANHDWLSGLPNRLRLRDLFERSTAAGLAAPPVGMMLIGLDRFKQVNDSIGHTSGDRLLAMVGRRLRAALPDEVVLGRFGGDQFVMMLADVDGSRLLQTLSELAGRITAELDRPLTIGPRNVRLSATMGAALYPRDAAGFEGMLQCLDAASYAAKSSRRGGLLFFAAGMRERLAGRMDIEQALKGALANDEIVLHYQPVVDAHTHRARSAEALMRWQRPGVGLVMPDDFIDVAEQSGLIGQLGNWAIGEVCRQMKAWQSAGVAIETLNVNVSSVQLADDDFERQVRDTLAATGLDPQCLTLEVTETALIGRFEEGVERLKRLRALGVRIMVDDFGTGYASLKYLKLLPVDGLKIDRLFVKDLPDSPADEAIVTAVVSLARASGFKLVAEGIETSAQAELLRDTGVPLLQGFLFARGLPAEAFAGFVQAAGAQRKLA